MDINKYLNVLINESYTTTITKKDRSKKIKDYASSKLNMLTIFSLVLTIITPIILHNIKTFHFVILPTSFYFYLMGLVLLYFIIVSIIKRIYIAKYDEWL